MKMIKYVIILLLIFQFYSCSNDKIDFNDLRSRIQELKQRGAGQNIDNLKNNLKEFEELLNICLSAFENQHQALRYLGVQCLQRQMYDPAIEYLSKALKIKSEDADLHYYIAIAYANKGKRDNSYNFKAEQSYKDSLIIQPNNSLTLYSLGILYYYHLNQKENAIQVMNKAYQYAAKYEYKPSAMLARFYFEKGDFAESVKYYKDAAERASTPKIKAKLLMNTGIVYQKMNDTANAKLYFENALNLDDTLKGAQTLFDSLK
ncbi:MAG TPA: tetratricopeptide repeat protein [bacterium]|nr:tetratricopeptide repeat protein [bacterium]HPN29990.1 tetratricopeptide repeat protein [bacterium]